MAKVLHDMPGIPPLNLLETVEQSLSVEVPYCGNVLHDGSHQAFVAVCVDVDGSNSNVPVSEGIF